MKTGTQGIPVYLSASASAMFLLFRLEDQEDQVEEDAGDGREDDRRDAVWKQDRNIEGKYAVRQCKVAANTTDQDDRSYRQLLRIK